VIAQWLNHRGNRDIEAGGNKMEKTALLTAGIIFFTVSILHLLRFLFRIEVKIGNSIIPLWLSVLGFIFPLLLSLWMFNLLKAGSI